MQSSTSKPDFIQKVMDEAHWMPEDFSGNFYSLYEGLAQGKKKLNVAQKIGVMLVEHQVLHQFTLELIDLAHMCIQASILPELYEPEFDKGRLKTSGWYIEYLENIKIDFKGKDEYIRSFRVANRLRNKVGHHIIEKNDVIVQISYDEFKKEFVNSLCIYNDQCLIDLLRILKQRKTAYDNSIE